MANRLALRVPYGEWAAPLLTMQIEPRLGVSLKRLSPQNSAAQIRAPVLVLGGGADLHTTLDDTLALFSAFSGLKQLEIFQNAAHVDLQKFDRPRYDAVVTAFLEARLAIDSHAIGVPITTNHASGAVQ